MPSYRQLVSRAFAFIIPLAFYAGLFFVPYPQERVKWGIPLVGTAVLILPIAACILYAWLSGKPAWVARVAILASILTIFVLAVLQLWRIAQSTESLILGLLPWMDGNSYYADAVRLLEGGQFGALSGRRPLFPGLLSVVLALTGKNLQLAFIIFIALNAIAVFFLLGELRPSLGGVASAVVMYLAYMFYRRFAPLALTEQLGFLLGALALAFLWRGAGNRNLAWYAWGIVLLTLGLIARAGAFFVIGTVVVYGFVLFLRENTSWSWKRGAILIVAAIMPFVLNSFITGQIVSFQSSSFGNFSYTLYGQAIGGKGWHQVLIDHPDINTTAEPETSTRIYAYAFEAIRENPWRLATGVLNSFRDFFAPDLNGAYGFVSLWTGTLTGLLRITCLVLLGVGLVTALMRWREPGLGLLFAAFCGIVFSIPFLPPIDADIMRVYAVTIPILAVLPAVGLVQIGRLLRRHAALPGLVYSQTPNLELAGFALLLGVLMLIGPLWIKWTSTAPVAKIVCPTGLDPLSFRLSSGSYINVQSDGSDHTTHVPDVPLQAANRSLQSFLYQDFGLTLQTINKPKLIIPTVNLVTNETVWVIAPPEITKYSLVQACVETVITPYYKVLYIKSYQ